MISIPFSALSGLHAYGKRLANNANNIANMNTERFKKGRVLLSEAKPQGVQAHFEKIETPGPQVAEESGKGMQMVEQSNVDLGEEFPEMILNQHAFRANLKSLQATDEMIKNVLDIKV
jgi:flagellar basal-body rod protein FlgC